MNLEQAIKTLEHYQKWRLGADLDQPKPKDITEAIDIAINILKPMNSPIK